jgi:adenylate cyclase
MSPSESRALSFRARLVLAFVAVVAAVLIGALVVIRRETDRQITRVLANAITDTRDALDRVERLRQNQLQQLGIRFGGSNRLPGALQQAVEGDTAFLASQINYELELAGLTDALAGFADQDGRPVYATVGNQRLNPAQAINQAILERALIGDTSSAAYQLVAGKLYSVHPVVLQIITQPVGYLVLGFPLDDAVATQIGEAIRADVCFVAQNECVAATAAARAPELQQMMVATPPRTQRRVSSAGHNYAVVGESLTGNAGNIAVAMRIDDVLAPFTHIQSALRIVGAAALLVGVLLAVLIARSLAHPVRALVRATEKVAQGDYEARVDVTTRDELGRLAGAFNVMTHGLLLKDRYRGVLDKVVSRDIAEELLKGEITLGGENREVTMLFTDIRGFTALTRGMEPQRIIHIINEIMEQLSAAVEAEEGVVDKYVGDELMALFGAPIAHLDDPQRAVRAALRMQQAVAEWCNGLGDRVRVRVGVGINTGTVVAGNMGTQRRLNYTVLGEPVNLAARLCSAAEPGQILVSESTNERISADFVTMPLGMRSVKGFSRPLAVYEVLDYATPLVNAGR